MCGFKFAQVEKTSEHALFHPKRKYFRSENRVRTRLENVDLVGRYLARPGGNWTEFLFLTRLRLALVVSVGAPQKWNFIEHVLLEPLQPEVNHRCDEERDHL